tara:strand:+ start:154901 stop:155626 length:726 start_codon:yes stop_codon:yes gene_type:complete
MISSANTETISELSLRYRMMSNDYQTSSDLLDSVFGNFLRTQNYWSVPSSNLAHNKEFLVQLQRFSQAMNQLVSEQTSDEKKRNSLESLITIMSESASANERLTGQSLPKIYQDYLKSMMSNPSANPADVVAAGIQIKTNEVLKTVGTYGIWGFWFVTSTWGLMALSPKMEHFLYYPAVSMFLASAPFSISNQIWGQVFDRLEKKAALQHKTTIQYMKDKIRSFKYFKRTKKNQCLGFYNQ